MSASSERAAKNSPAARSHEIAPKRILVPTDFSRSADRAIDYAVRLARLYNAEILVLHVFELQEYLGLLSEKAQVDKRTADEVLETTKRHAVDSLEETVRRHSEPEVPVIPVFLVGVPFEEIVQYAAQREVDLIVMPTHGRTGLAHFFLGNTTERVIARATCPVLVVKCCPCCEESEAGTETESALQILKKRYAKGEISKEEFDRMKKDITGD